MIDCFVLFLRDSLRALKKKKIIKIIPKEEFKKSLESFISEETATNKKNKYEKRIKNEGNLFSDDYSFKKLNSHKDNSNNFNHYENFSKHFSNSYEKSSKNSYEDDDNFHIIKSYKNSSEAFSDCSNLPSEFLSGSTNNSSFSDSDDFDAIFKSFSQLKDKKSFSSDSSIHFLSKQMRNEIDSDLNIETPSNCEKNINTFLKKYEKSEIPNYSNKIYKEIEKEDETFWKNYNKNINNDKENSTLFRKKEKNADDFDSQEFLENYSSSRKKNNKGENVDSQEFLENYSSSRKIFIKSEDFDSNEFLKDYTSDEKRDQEDDTFWKNYYKKVNKTERELKGFYKNKFINADKSVSEELNGKMSSFFDECSLKNNESLYKRK